MVQLPKFGHMSKSTIKFDSCGKVVLVVSIDTILKHFWYIILTAFNTQMKLLYFSVAS